ncbi:MAG: nucleotidyltransferase domain-containing protein [Selenomonadaceae bacterium]|nr:nucleotidyltransferase domain-containing protein [Selenomonadaceae bacterium]
MPSEFEHIKFLVDRMAVALKPLKIYLFGSFAEGTATAESDYDFYIVMPDSDKRHLLDLMTEAQRALRHQKRCPVDVIVNRQAAFEAAKTSALSIENVIAHKGILLYGN